MSRAVTFGLACSTGNIHSPGAVNTDAHRAVGKEPAIPELLQIVAKTCQHRLID